jgi:hypothetical protein
MHLPSQGFLAQMHTSLHNLTAILDETKSQPRFCICYLTHAGFISIAKQASPVKDSVMVIVPRLPKDALIEWHVLAQKASSSTKDAAEVGRIGETKSFFVWDTDMDSLHRSCREIQTEISELIMIRIFYHSSLSQKDIYERVLSMFPKAAIAMVPVLEIEQEAKMALFCLFKSNKEKI